MVLEIKVPAAGESVTEATIAEWLKSDGDYIERDEVLLVLETDKASMDIVAEKAGKVSIKAEEGDTVQVGAIVATIDTNAKAPAQSATPAAQPTTAAAAVAAPQRTSTSASTMSPAVRHTVGANNLNPNTITPTGPAGRITKADAVAAAHAAAQPAAQAQPAKAPLPALPNMQSTENKEWREPMSRIRKTIAKRLVQAQQTAAILTTFNEIDMTAVKKIRAQYKESFLKKHNVKLGFMGFFVKATVAALKEFPMVNASIDENEFIMRNFANVGIAVGTKKGLLVPVIKNADKMSIAEIELSIQHYAGKARDGKISLDDLQDGTFTISNGGVYGSLMSTPILNPPQSGILGLHKIEDRPIAVKGEVVVRPMMYIALSYDHRVIDGSESVKFLVKIKEGMEDPSRLLLEL